jgi:hypothetical protein
MPLPGTRRVCGAHTRAGGSCQNPAMGNGRCRMHGGKAARGTEHGRFTHGRYSSSIPDRLAERFEEALRDEDRHDLRDEIALSEAKIYDLFSSMRDGPAGSASEAGERRAWKEVERWVARKTRLVVTDAKLAQERQQVVSVEEVMTLMAGILRAIKWHVPDQQTRAALAREIRALGTREADQTDEEE